MSLASTIATGIRNIWSSLRSMQAEIRRMSRDLVEVQRVQKKNTDLLPGALEYGPLGTIHQLVVLKITSFVGGTPTLWNAKRQMLGPGGFLIDDDEDLRTYIVEQALGANGIFEDSFGFAVFGRLDPGPPKVAIYKMVSSDTIKFLGKAICTPPGSDPLIAEVYYVQLLGILAGAPADPAPPIVTDQGSNPIGVATNLKEITTHTHGVRVGSTFEVTVTTDDAGKQRWYFSACIGLMVMALGGAFRSIGVSRADGLGFLQADHWDRDIGPPVPMNDPNQVVKSPPDYTFFGGTDWICGILTLDFLPGGTTQKFGLGWFNKSTGRYVGVQTRPGGGDNLEGKLLYLWKSPTGDRLIYVEKSSGVAATVVEITFDEATKTVTVIDIGWTASVGSNSQPAGIIAWHDGTEDGLLIFGFYIGGNYDELVRWNGQSFSSIGETGGGGNDTINAAGLHDFQDGLGERPVVYGLFTIMGGVSCLNVAALNPQASTWGPVGSGLTLPGFAVPTAIQSFNDILWASRNAGAVTNDALWCIANGQFSDWVTADKVIKNLARNGLQAFDQNTPLLPRPAAVSDLVLYLDQLMVSGPFKFRSGRRLKRTGPLVALDTTNDKFIPILPKIDGEPGVLIPYAGGLLVLGDVRGSFPGGVTILGGGLWFAPQVQGQDGTWQSIGDIIGTTYAAVVLNGVLHVFGDITSAGGVVVQGHAFKDGTGWHRGVTITGTPRAAVVVGADIVVAGDISKVNGQAQFKVAFKTDGTFVSTIFSNITAPDGLPFINALHVVGGEVFAGGWYDTIDGVTAHSVSSMNISTGAWSALDDQPSGTEGVKNGRVVWSLSDANGLIYVGTDSDAQLGLFGSSGLWTWDSTVPEFRPSTIPGQWAGPTKAMTRNSAASLVYAGVQLDDGFDIQNSIYKLPGDVILGQGEGVVFSDTIAALCHCDAGDGNQLYGSGPFDSIGGNSTIPATSPAQCIVAITKDNVMVDVAGGAGFADFQSQFPQQESITRMRVVQLPGEGNTTADIDPATGAAVSAEMIYVFGINGMAFDEANGTLFGVTESHLFTHDRIREETTIVGLIDLVGPVGLAFNQTTGEMFSSSGSDLISIDPVTGSGTIIGGFGLDRITGMAFDSAGTLFAIDGKQLFTIDTATGAATLVGGTGMVSLVALTEQGGRLLTIAAGSGDLVDINKATGTASIIGALGLQSVASLAYNATTSKLVGATTRLGVACRHLVCLGPYATVNDRYSQFVCGIDINGKLIATEGGLSGKSDSGSAGVKDAKAIPRSRWPAYWLTILDDCQPNVGYAWLISGNFSHAVNNNLSDAEIGNLEDDIVCNGVILMVNRRFYRIIPEQGGSPGYISLKNAEVFNGQPIVAGQAPKKWVGDHLSGQWEHLRDPTLAGSFPAGLINEYNHQLEHGGLLWFVGQLKVNPLTSATKQFGIATWDGSAVALIAPPGWAGVSDDDVIQNGDVKPKGNCLAFGDIGDGNGDLLYAGGRPNTGGPPVVVKASGGWQAFGGSGLTGECNSLAIVNDPAGGYVLAGGELFVDGVAADFAKSDGTTWVWVGEAEGFGAVNKHTGVGDSLGHASCETGPLGFRALMGGALGAIDVGGQNTVQAFSIIQYRPGTGLETIPGGGVAGDELNVIASAQQHLW